EDFLGNIQVSNLTQHPTETAAELEAFNIVPIDDGQRRPGTPRRNPCLVNAFRITVTNAFPMMTDEPDVLSRELEWGASKHRVTSMQPGHHLTVTYVTVSGANYLSTASPPAGSFLLHR